LDIYFCMRQFALHRQQPEKDKQNIDFAPPGISADVRVRLHPCIPASYTIGANVVKSLLEEYDHNNPRRILAQPQQWSRRCFTS